MKEYNSHSKSGHLAFYLVLTVCTAMVGVSCWFAYTQTANDLTIQLDSAMDSVSDMAAAELESSIAKPETSDPTETQASAYVPPVSTTPPPTEAVIPDTEQVALTVTEAADEVQTEASAENVTEFTSANPPCRPLEGEILEEFSNGELVKSSTTGVWQTHNGVDIAGTLGDAVCAMDSGIVTSIDEDPLWGVCVTIDHQNGIFSRYCNLNAGLSVNMGDAVKNGDVIGALGDTADIESAMDTHLHLEVLQGEHYLDPIAYIDGE